MKRVKWGRCEQGAMRIVWAGWSGDVLNRELWGCFEQGAVGMLRTGCCGDVTNRVQWGCCEEGDERSISRPNLRPAQIPQCLSLWAVLSVRCADIWRWRRKIWCFGLDVSAENVQFWFICRKYTETDADMKIMQTAALCTTKRGGDAVWYLSWGVTYRL